MSKRVEQIVVRHRPSETSNHNDQIIINNIQDINKTLALIYDKMTEEDETRCAQNLLRDYKKWCEDAVTIEFNKDGSVDAHMGGWVVLSPALLISEENIYTYLIDHPKDEVYIETKDGRKDEYTSMQWIYEHLTFDTSNIRSWVKAHDYGKTWRVWTSKPTDEQRKEQEWK